MTGDYLGAKTSYFLLSISATLREWNPFFCLFFVFISKYIQLEIRMILNCHLSDAGHTQEWIRPERENTHLPFVVTIPLCWFHKMSQIIARSNVTAAEEQI